MASSSINWIANFIWSIADDGLRDLYVCAKYRDVIPPNAETYAICKADLLLQDEGDAADNIVRGPEHSTLANDAIPSREFAFMFSNPPYGMSWKTDLARMVGKDGLKDPRFLIEHGGDAAYSLVTVGGAARPTRSTPNA